VLRWAYDRDVSSALDSEHLRTLADLRTKIINGGTKSLSLSVPELLEEFGLTEIDESGADWFNDAFDTVGLKCRPKIAAGMSVQHYVRLTATTDKRPLPETVSAVMVSTTFEIPGYDTIEFLGEVFGLTVRIRNPVSRLGSGAKSIVGGELGGLTRLLEQGRRDALSRLRSEAQRRGANAVIGLRYDTSEMGVLGDEVVAYGTAVVVRDAGAHGQT
jgi:uncharacterized protein YbjQ (UPF0145 family)